MKLLAVDTATEACSAALLVDGRILERYAVVPRGHAELVLPMVDEVLGEAGLALAELDYLAFGRGPGAFTGLRIAAGVVQGLAFGASLRVVPVSDLEALARRAWRTHGAERVWAVIDARMGELYSAAYVVKGEGIPQPVGPEEVGAAGTISAPSGAGWFLAGSGVAAHGVLLASRVGGRVEGQAPDLLPAAHDIAKLAATRAATDAVMPAEAQPVYLRDRVAEIPR